MPTKPSFKEGEAVTFTRVRSRGSQIEFMTLSVTIVRLSEHSAVIKLRNGYQMAVRLDRLRKIGEPSELNALVQQLGTETTTTHG
jgi:hypothetical protein